MAWCPFAQKLELQPESDSQPAIRPTQLIMHSIAAPWTPGRIYEYWRDSTNLESTFGLGFDGSLAQFIGTETRADANAQANRRSDGTGAVSIETASNLQHTDPWTDAQIATLIRLGVWMHQRHGVPLRICRTWDDPGFGYHRMFPQWSVGGTECPGDARVKQFRDIVFPGIVRAAQGGTLPDVQEDDPMAGMTANDIYDAVWNNDRMLPPDGAATPDNPTWQPMSVLLDAASRVRVVQQAVAAQTAAIQTLAGLVGTGVDTAAVVAAVRAAIADAVVHVDVAVTGQQGGGA